MTKAKKKTAKKAQVSKVSKVKKAVAPKKVVAKSPVKKPAKRATTTKKVSGATAPVSAPDPATYPGSPYDDDDGNGVGGFATYDESGLE